LPGGSSFSCREPCPGDLAEGWAADDVARRAEIRMVEEGEHVDAALETALLRWPSGLADRQIRVSEARSNDHVPPQISKAVDGHEDSGGAPTVHRTDEADWSCEIRANGVRRAGQAGVARHDIHRIAALRLH